MGHHRTDSVFRVCIRTFTGRLKFILLAAIVIIPVECAWADLLALVGGTIFTAPDAVPIVNGVVLLDGDNIMSVGMRDTVAIPAEAKSIDALGLYITAGFWNSHVHYIGVFQGAAWKDPDTLNNILSNTFLRWGFVNTVDLGSWLNNTLTIRERIQKGEVNGPRIITAASGFAPLGGSPFYIKSTKLPEFHNPGDAREKVLSALKAGADVTKLFTGSWSTRDTVIVMQADDMRAATKAAHEQGALVFAHPADSDGARVAIENGVDILAHVFPSQMKGPWDRNLPAEMAAQNMVLIPTIMLWRLTLTDLGLPSDIVSRNENAAIAQTRAIHEAGTTILFGTDVGFMQETNTTNEFRLMQQAGMDYKDILTSLTTAPAARYKLSATDGRIQNKFHG